MNTPARAGLDSVMSRNPWKLGRGRCVTAGLALAIGLLASLNGLAICGWPVIFTQPQSQTHLAGSSATFTVMASNTCTMTYQWRFYGANIQGATNATLMLSNVQPAQAGPYSVWVQNADGSTVSSNALLTVNTAASFTNALAVTISDHGPAALYPSTLLVPNLPGTVAKVKVTLDDLTHPFPDDLDIMLVGPNGAGVLLMSDAGGGSGLTNVTLGFEDAAGGALPSEGQIRTGTFKPCNYDANDWFQPPAPPGPYATDLSVFNGINPTGPWNLYVWDDTTGNTGLIRGGWRLTLTVAPPTGNVFLARLSGTNEVPPNYSMAMGSGTLLLSANGELTYNIVYSGLASNFTGAHLCGPAGRGSNAVPLFPLANLPSGQRAGVLRGTHASFSGQQLWDLRGGLHYVNIRSIAFTNGEIRGQILPLPPPVITRQPLSRMAYPGDIVEFAVTASSPVPLGYEWRWNGAQIPEGTNLTLMVPNVQPDNAGIYDVVVSNPAGSVASAPAFLTVMSQLVEVVGVPLGSRDSRPLENYASPQPGHSNACGSLGAASRWLSLQPEDAGTLILETTGSGIDTIMAVYVGTNSSEIHYVGCDDNSAADGINCWYRLSCEPGKIYTVEIDGVNGAQGAMQLNWRCGLEPVITMQPMSHTAQMGETVSFRVAAAGVPPPDYQWQFNGKDKAGETNDTLVVPQVRPADAGQYRVIARNFIDAEASAAAQLTVEATVALSSWEFEEGGFHFHVTCPAGVTVEIDASTDLRNWTPLLITNTPSGRIEFVDPAAASHPQRFYRAQVY